MASGESRECLKNRLQYAQDGLCVKRVMMESGARLRSVLLAHEKGHPRLVGSLTDGCGHRKRSGSLGLTNQL